MRVLSTKLPMTETFTEKELYGVIIKWLKNAGPCKPIGEAFEICTECKEEIEQLQADFN